MPHQLKPVARFKVWSRTPSYHSTLESARRAAEAYQQRSGLIVAITETKPKMATIKLKPGYAFASSNRHPRDPETVVTSSVAVQHARFVGYANIDGRSCLAFRLGKPHVKWARYYFQTAASHGAAT